MTIVRQNLFFFALYNHFLVFLKPAASRCIFYFLLIAHRDSFSSSNTPTVNLIEYRKFIISIFTYYIENIWSSELFIDMTLNDEES